MSNQRSTTPFPHREVRHSLLSGFHREAAAELSGRAVAYAYDSLYRLTTETVTSDPHNNNG